MEWDMGILKDGANGRRELLPTLSALQYGPFHVLDVEPIALLALAVRADNAIWPSESDEEVLCGLLVIHVLLAE
jgi:hypothetical protein